MKMIAESRLEKVKKPHHHIWNFHLVRSSFLLDLALESYTGRVHGLVYENLYVCTPGDFYKVRESERNGANLVLILPDRLETHNV